MEKKSYPPIGPAREISRRHFSTNPLAVRRSEPRSNSENRRDDRKPARRGQRDASDAENSADAVADAAASGRRLPTPDYSGLTMTSAGAVAIYRETIPHTVADDARSSLYARAARPAGEFQ
jgi:hypothetical protein